MKREGKKCGVERGEEGWAIPVGCEGTQKKFWRTKAKGSNERNPQEGWQQSLKKVIIKMTSAAKN